MLPCWSPVHEQVPLHKQVCGAICEGMTGKVLRAVMIGKLRCRNLFSSCMRSGSSAGEHLTRDKFTLIGVQHDCIDSAPGGILSLEARRAHVPYLHSAIL